VASEEYKQKAEEQGAFAVYMGPDELGAYAKKEIDYWGKVIRTAGIKGEE
jgi:tripartite-type tricarboxylate transporter receptor subunit TctC